ncbi:MAG: hypothetical protein VR65_04360 [Desulfobulbaceae bacterium BRH_c16a]|nr:MAG: hypothetical protein VR65_04360 [Desulfobulbaceae bacterium BRH_c16a]
MVACVIPKFLQIALFKQAEEMAPTLIHKPMAMTNQKKCGPWHSRPTMTLIKMARIVDPYAIAAIMIGL